MSLRMNIPLPGPFTYSAPVAPAVSGCLFWVFVGPLLFWWWVILGVLWLTGALTWCIVKAIQLSMVGVLRLVQR